MEMNIALLSNARVVHSLYLQYTEGRETGLSPQLAQRILHGRSQFWASLGESLKPWNRFDISILCGELAGNGHNCIPRVIQGFADNCAPAWVFTEWVETLQRLERLGAHIWVKVPGRVYHQLERVAIIELCAGTNGCRVDDDREALRSEEHTSELQSQSNLVCRLLLEKKKKKNTKNIVIHIT